MASSSSSSIDPKMKRETKVFNKRAMRLASLFDLKTRNIGTSSNTTISRHSFWDSNQVFTLIIWGLRNAIREETLSVLNFARNIFNLTQVIRIHIESGLSGKHIIGSQKKRFPVLPPNVFHCKH